LTLKQRQASPLRGEKRFSADRGCSVAFVRVLSETLDLVDIHLLAHSGIPDHEPSLRRRRRIPDVRKQTDCTDGSKYDLKKSQDSAGVEST
jgi:hypothetical protein